jgi:hypothetical protein
LPRRLISGRTLSPRLRASPPDDSFAKEAHQRERCPEAAVVLPSRVPWATGTGLGKTRNDADTPPAPPPFEPLFGSPGPVCRQARVRPPSSMPLKAACEPTTFTIRSLLKLRSNRSFQPSP